MKSRISQSPRGPRIKCRFGSQRDVWEGERIENSQADRLL